MVGRLLVFAGVCGALLAARPADAEARQVHGATILDEVRPLEGGRFESMKDWEKTIEFFSRVYRGKPGYLWRSVDTPPGVKAIHIASTLPRTAWEGINVYETKGKIHIFVVKRNVAASGRKPSK